MADKIIQDPRFLQQIFSHLSSEQIGGMNIAIVGELNITNEAKKFDFYDFLMLLPEPRMESLKNMAIKTALEHCKRKIDTARFLGISHRTITGRLEDQTEPKDLILIEGGKENSVDG